MSRSKLKYFCTYSNFSYETEDGFDIMVIEIHNKVVVYAEFENVICKIICFDTKALELFYNISPDDFIEKSLEYMRILFNNHICVDTVDVNSFWFEMKQNYRQYNKNSHITYMSYK